MICHWKMKITVPAKITILIFMWQDHTNGLDLARSSKITLSITFN